MDPRTSAQDVMRCDLCETAVVQMYCDTCLVNLCKACVGEHFSADLSTPHKIVDFKNRKSTLIYPGCKSHKKEQCTMYCNQCDIPICTKCIASDQHLGHKVSEILQVVDEKKEKIIKKQTELNDTIYPTYQDIASDVQDRMSQLEKEYGDLSTAITKHGENWHREIDTLVKKLKTEVDEMKNIQLQTLQKHLDEINKTISDIKDEISSVHVPEGSENISKLFSITINVDRYRNLPQKILPPLPEFTPGRITGGELGKIFGSLSPNSLTSDKHDYIMKTTQKSPEAGSSPPVKQLLDEPATVTNIHTEFGEVCDVACLSDEEIWTRGDNSTMKLYSISRRSLLKSIRAKSGVAPSDIAVTKSGDLVYTDYSDRTVNFVKNSNERIEEVFTLKDWRPYNVCSTSSGDLLVVMVSNDVKQTKVVRYSGSTEKQTIQFDENGKPLYSSFPSYFQVAYNPGAFHTNFTENRNLDICVSDNRAKAVVVVNQAGKLRFRYTGHTAPSFCPRGITTDSQGHILIADDNNDCVHIIDQDGQFLRFIHCELSDPLGLCTDKNDNLFVAQNRNGKVMKIKYLQ
ncbi:tripartite motif-containing protein 55-like [Saccostrea echinata]|uniref:tripartite motif-containing protein 55-like n=1 Tax=Saccostrea echinata TaxID=191078 RepID=UPI002A7F9988|nr:tripartite motif-containing protein 55-like [Saccostrea echinata]